MSLTRLIPSLMALTIGAVLTAAPAPARAQVQLPIVIDSVDLTDFQIVDNVLTASGTVTGTLAGLPFTTDITDFALQLIPDNPATPGVECSVLHLELGPINLALLGLFVDTSQICLDITATEGGGLLGDLLCGLAGGDGGLGIPLLPTGEELLALETALTDILGGSLTSQPAAQGGGGDVCTGECEVLDLALGPIDLSLLGLNVSLDDCANGAVLVCISASAGQGLLGDLLCGLTGDIGLGDLLALLDALRGIPNLANIQLPGNSVRGLISQLNDALADGALSTREIEKLVKFVAKRA